MHGRLEDRSSIREKMEINIDDQPFIGQSLFAAVVVNVPTVQQILCVWDSQPDRTCPGIGKLITLSLCAEPQNVMMLERLETQSSSQKCYLTVTWLHAVYKQGTVLVFQVRPCSLVRRHSWATLDKAFEYFWKKKKRKKKSYPPMEAPSRISKLQIVHSIVLHKSFLQKP